MIIIEEFTYSVGDIVKLDYNAFKNTLGSSLLKSNHMFVVVSEDGTVCEVSSQNQKVADEFPWNVRIRNWKSAGLWRPSHVKTDTSGVIEDPEVFKLVGHLSEFDLSAVLNAYKKAPQNYLLEWVNDQILRKQR